jgi:ribosome biogenesis GTPase / thiamine phosphate phosphatase
LETAIVLKSTGSWYRVKTDAGKVLDCKIRGNLKISGIRSTNPVSVGDIVDVDTTIGVILNIHQRKNYIIRKSSNLSKESHIIASNIDRAYFIYTLYFPKTPLAFLDRFLITAEAYRIPVTIIFNKVDLYDEEQMSELKKLQRIYEKIDYTCYQVSALTNYNIDFLKSKIIDKVNLLSGHSGVGKSMLINRLVSSATQKTGIISESHHKGKHTTTFAEMFETDENKYIIDTPGIKGFGLIDFQQRDLYHYFPEIFRVAADCQFSNCVHTNEPGCAVKKAVENKEISIERYSSYVSILLDEGNKYRK